MISSTKVAAAAEIRRFAPSIGQDTEEILADMYSDMELCTTGIIIAQGAQINEILRRSEVHKSLEIGFAYGFSTLWILDALRSNGNSRHFAIDPFEKIYWREVGLQQVKRLNGAPDFEWIDDYSIHALPSFIRRKEQFDFIFIDGNHRFDDVLVDFYLSDQLLRPGGLVAFDDMWMHSVRTAVNFVLTNRKYEIVPQPVGNMMILKKNSDDDRDWRHFKKFKIATNSKFRGMISRLAHRIGIYEILRGIRSRVLYWWA